MSLSERINDTNAAPWVIEEIKRLEAERDALAAHVERMSKAALDAIHYLPGGDIKAELRDAYDETPETSLARLKAEWQAEAISRYAFHHLGGHEQELAEIYAGKLRRQAEEATDGR